MRVGGGGLDCLQASEGREEFFTPWSWQSAGETESKGRPFRMTEGREASGGVDGAGRDQGENCMVGAPAMRICRLFFQGGVRRWEEGCEADYPFLRAEIFEEREDEAVPAGGQLLQDDLEGITRLEYGARRQRRPWPSGWR